MRYIEGDKSGKQQQRGRTYANNYKDQHIRHSQQHQPCECTKRYGLTNLDTRE